MLFKVPNTDGKPPARTGVHPHFSTPVDPEDGTFELPDDHPQFEAVKETLVEQGHTPVDSTEEPQSESETAEPNLDNLTEEAIVRMEYRELQQIAGEFEDIKGNAPKGEIEEALIKKVRADE